MFDCRGIRAQSKRIGVHKRGSVETRGEQEEVYIQNSSEICVAWIARSLTLLDREHDESDRMGSSEPRW
jgi:hypothetical protein